MRFDFSVSKGKTRIEAIFEEDDDITGNREEGAGTEITIKDKTIVYDYPVKEIHPDILGLICLTNFYPFMGGGVTFPKAVSPRLVRAFERGPFLDKKKLEFRNVDKGLEKFSGSKIALAFGGGVDSSSVREMFPEAFVVHEAHIRDGEVVESFSHEVVKRMEGDRGKLVTTNARFVSLPGGWHSWPCSMNTALLMATDFDFGLILCGTVMGSNYLWNGNKYYDRHAARELHGFSGNYWQSTFHEIGIPLFSPIDGISEFGSMRVSSKLLERGEVVYCMEADGNSCNKCTKCFRREVIRSVVDDTFEPNWENYDVPFIHGFLEKRPLYFGHIYSYARKVGKLPDWADAKIRGVQEIKSDWPLHYFEPAMDFCPEEWVETICERIRSNFDMMSKSEEKELVRWNQEENNVNL